jgi:predicted nucleotidyltransferase
MNLIFHDLLGVLIEVYIDDVVVKSVGFEEHDRLKIVARKDKEVWTTDEPIEVQLRGNIRKVLGVYNT